METTCSHCGKRLKLPDERLPQGQRLSVTCPGCGKKIIIDTRTPPRSAPEQTQEYLDRFDEFEASDYGEDTSLGFYEEGTKLALVLDSDPGRREIVRDAAESLGYRYVEADGTRDAIGKMRFHVFDLVLLAEGFDGQPLAHSPIINSLNHAPMSVRRRIFLSLLGDQFTSMDKMMAFAMSANVVIGTSDMDKLAKVLQKAISENHRFYKVFNDCLKETGRA
jgi:DNA-directed RNA polymerase subunit RPC12/RpoP